MESETVLVDPVIDFDPSFIFSGPPVYVRKQVSYVGHATTTYSVEQAITIIDYIGQKTKSDNCLPFAVRLVEGGEMISISEDNGEFATGDLLATCLKKVEGFNILVCVSRKVENLFVTDMVQAQKHRAIKEAATKVLEMLYASLTKEGSQMATTEDPELLAAAHGKTSPIRQQPSQDTVFNRSTTTTSRASGSSKARK